MAKKEKVQLTPEEIAERKIRRSDGWTRFWAIVVALALTAGVFAFARTQGIKASEGTEVETSENADNNSNNNSTNTNTNTNTNNSTSTDTNTNTNTNTNTDSNTNQGGSNSSTPVDNGGSGDSTNANDPASVAALINKVTGEAVGAKAGYNWERHGEVNNIDVGGATDTLNKIIQGVDSNADLNSVVGGFLGRGDKAETVPKGQTLDTIDVQKDDGTTEKVYHGSSYTMKATNLQAGDIQNLQVNGNTYEFDLPDSDNPDRSGNTPLSRFCNDIVIQSEVDSEIKDFVSVVSVNSLETHYKNIHVKAVIADGKLQELSYSFTATAALGIKAAFVPINGTGDMVANAKYSNISY